MRDATYLISGPAGMVSAINSRVELQAVKSWLEGASSTVKALHWRDRLWRFKMTMPPGAHSIDWQNVDEADGSETYHYPDAISVSFVLNAPSLGFPPTRIDMTVEDMEEGGWDERIVEYAVALGAVPARAAFFATYSVSASSLKELVIAFCDDSSGYTDSALLPDFPVFVASGGDGGDVRNPDDSVALLDDEILAAREAAEQAEAAAQRAVSCCLLKETAHLPLKVASLRLLGVATAPGASIVLEFHDDATDGVHSLVISRGGGVRPSWFDSDALLSMACREVGLSAPAGEAAEILDARYPLPDFQSLMLVWDVVERFFPSTRMVSFDG